MQTNDNLILPDPDAPQLLYDKSGWGNLAEGQCDCACVAAAPPVQPAISPALTPNLSFALADPYVVIPLTATHSVVLTGSTALPLVLNQPALAVAYHFAQARSAGDSLPLCYERWGEAAVRSTLAHMVALGLLVPQGDPGPTPAGPPVTLSAWLHLTDRCNLRCAYCYLPHHQVDMSPATGRAALEATFRSAVTHRYRQVKIKYAGGEPTLCFPMVTELHEYAQALAGRAGLALDGVVLSNGTRLTRPMIEAIKSAGLRLMVSVDGWGDAHDRQRYYAGGRGSFRDVKRGIELALTHHLIPDISITVSSANAAELPSLMAWLLDGDLPFSLNFYRENDCAAPGENVGLAGEKIITGMRAAFKAIEARLPRRSLLAGLVDRANLATPHHHTCSAGHHYLVFDPHGRVARCQMQINHTVTTAWAADPLLALREGQAGIQNLPVEEKEDCGDCRWRYWCTGGCPLATYRATGRYDVKSPYCSIYQALYPEAVRLEGLRLLKYAGEMN